MEARRISVKKKKILHFAADISPKALGLEERNATLNQNAENKMMHWKWFLRCKGSRWQLNWGFVLMMWMCLRQKIGIGPRTANPLFPDKPPLFSHPACRMNCNTSPCVPLKEQSQLHARPHGGNVTDSVCVSIICVCVCRHTILPFLPRNTINKGHCECMTVRSHYPNYRRLLITSGVIRNQAAVAPMTCLWETWRNAAAGDETVNYAFFTLKCTHHQDVAARSWQCCPQR